VPVLVVDHGAEEVEQVAFVIVLDRGCVDHLRDLY
jgi:hypothetical protein